MRGRQRSGPLGAARPDRPENGTAGTGRESDTARTARSRERRLDHVGGRHSHPGRAGRSQGRARCPDAAQGPLLGPAGGDGHRAHRLRRLRQLGGVRQQELLRRGVAPPGPHLAVLLALPDRQLRTGEPSGHGHHLVDHLAGAADPHLPPGIPPDLLLLPEGLLPGLLAGPAGLCRFRRAQLLHRRVAVPADPAERAPVLLLLRPGVQRHPDHRRRGRLPPAGNRHRVQRGHGRPHHQRHPVVAVLPQLPCLPAPVRRRGQAVLALPRPASSSGRP